MNNVIKYAALGLGGYFLLQKLLPTLQPASSTAPATTGGGSTSGNQETKSTETKSTVKPAPPPTTTDLQLKQAAAAEQWAHLAKGKQLNFHQWNWYRREYAPALATPSPEDVGMGDGTKLITAEEYHAALKAGGLAGLALRAAAWGR
jgi:hypothetical protein